MKFRRLKNRVIYHTDRIKSLSLPRVLLLLKTKRKFQQNPLLLPRSLPVPPDSDKYLIGPEDVLFIQVWKEEAVISTGNGQDRRQDFLASH